MLNESAASSAGANSILLRNMLDTEEGISDETHPSATMIVNEVLQHNLISCSPNKISTKS